MSDPVADAYAALKRRDSAAIEAFFTEAGRVFARFPGLAGEMDVLRERALAGAIDAIVEFRSIELAAQKHAFKAVHQELASRANNALFDDPGAPADRVLFAKLLNLPPNARTFAIAVFVKRGEFVETIQTLNINGTALAVEITEIRRLANPQAGVPPAADIPAYVRVPFLVTGKMAPDEALRVREYLGQSEACRGAYRDLDLLERKIVRLGPAAAEPHPDGSELLQVADAAHMAPGRRDIIEEHVRLCAGCGAVMAELRATAPRRAGESLMEKIEERPMRRKLSIVTAAAAFLLPVLLYEFATERKTVLEFGGAGGADLGSPLGDDPSRPPLIVSYAATREPAVSVKVQIEQDLVYDAEITNGATSIVTSGDVPVLRLAGEEKGIITFTLRGARLGPGDYQLHLYRRKRGAGGEPGNLIYPIRVER